MLLCIPVSIIYGEPVIYAFIKSGLVCFGLGSILLFITRKHQKVIKKREGYLIVTLGWLMLAFTGSLPYFISGYIPLFTDAFFETISGYTTTGATILNEIETLPKSI